MQPEFSFANLIIVKSVDWPIKDDVFPDFLDALISLKLIREGSFLRLILRTSIRTNPVFYLYGIGSVRFHIHLF